MRATRLHKFVPILTPLETFSLVQKAVVSKSQIYQKPTSTSPSHLCLCLSKRGASVREKSIQRQNELRHWQKKALKVCCLLTPHSLVQLSLAKPLLQSGCALSFLDTCAHSVQSLSHTLLIKISFATHKLNNTI